MSEALDWLQTELHPVAMRIARADECAQSMGEIAAQWSLQNPVDLEQVRHGDRYTTRVIALRPIPPRISLLFSEAVNHLRAALDNVIWCMVREHQGPVTGRAATLISLPNCPDAETFDKWIGRRLRLQTDSLTAFDPSQALHRRVRDLQPFVDQEAAIPDMNAFVAAHLGVGVERAHPLTLLQGYSNEDKHRSIRVAFSRTRTSRPDSWSDPQPFSELRVGDVVGEGVWGEPAVMEQTTAIQVPRPAPYSAPVTPANEISRLATYVARVAVPRLLTGTSPPGPLPMKVDLDDSGLTETERLNQGDLRTAEDRLRSYIAAHFYEVTARPPRFPTTRVEEQ